MPFTYTGAWSRLNQTSTTLPREIIRSGASTGEAVAALPIDARLIHRRAVRVLHHTTPDQTIAGPVQVYTHAPIRTSPDTRPGQILTLWGQGLAVQVSIFDAAAVLVGAIGGILPAGPVVQAQTLSAIVLANDTTYYLQVDVNGVAGDLVAVILEEEP